MPLSALCEALAEVFDGPLEVEQRARAALLEASSRARPPGTTVPLPASVLEVMTARDAHPACQIVAATPLNWVPPQTSADPDYVAHSLRKVHVELVGPDGLAPSNCIRLGLYGMRPHANYGIRTHPAEEVFVMMAGRASWKRGDLPFAQLGPGERSHHPSMMPHATSTGDSAFLSVYAWIGDIRTDGYVYHGITDT